MYVPHATTAGPTLALSFLSVAAASVAFPEEETSAATEEMVFMADLMLLGAVLAAFLNAFDRLLTAPEL